MIKISNYKKIIAGVVIAAAMFIFVCVNQGLFYSEEGHQFATFEYAAVCVLSAGVLLAYTIDFKGLPKAVYTGICVAVIAAVPFMIMQIAMLLAGDAEYSMGMYMTNVLLYTAPILIMYIITNSFAVSATVAAVVGALFNITSYVLNLFRGTPFIPTDILAVKTAAKVVSTYEFTFEWHLVSAIVLTVFIIAVIWAFPLKVRFKRSDIICRGAGAAALIAIAIPFFSIDYMGVDVDVFDQTHATNTHGTAYNFFINCRKMGIKKPAGYNEDDVYEMLANMDEDDKVSEERPNVIVIMNESYSDLNVVGEFKTNMDYNSFFMGLKRNTIRGELLVSPFGGYTCNTEFEFLSGLTMGLLPSGVAPYLQYLNKECPYFLPEHMNSLGYKTVALHPYYSHGWNRETVYPLMGFDNFISLENMGDYQDKRYFETIRSYYTDNTSYSAVIKQFETKGDKPLFMFNVTMQNHGGYMYGDSLLDDVRITSMRGSYPYTELYLSLLRKSDEALRVLIDYFENCGEPTVVVMFGDHQPAVEQSFYEELYGRPLDEVSAEELLDRYKVPFIIWANYDIESKTGIKTSVNYLSKLMLDAAGLPQNKINRVLEGIEDDVPQINAAGHYDAVGNWSKNSPDTSDAIKRYNYLEYFMMTHKPKEEEKK